MGGKNLDDAIAKDLPVGSTDRQATSLIQTGRGFHGCRMLWAVLILYPRAREASTEIVGEAKDIS